MKKLSVFLALLALFFVDLALAAGAVVTSTTGTVSVQTGQAASRTLRTGDQVAQGDTVITGANSATVLKFDDGQVVALTANSRMQVTNYAYNPATESGNVLLSLVTGGMRAITGLIGRRAPSQVAYRAATATIGIRGTDTTIATSEGNVVVTVSEGAVSFSFQGQTLTINAGEAVLARPGQPVVRGTPAQVTAQAPAAIQQAVAQQAALIAAVTNASPGSASQGQQGTTGTTNTTGDTTGQSTGPTGSTGGPQGGGAGGGSASGS
jgi:co-chaperonin GroES (HSP10)